MACFLKDGEQCAQMVSLTIKPMRVLTVNLPEWLSRNEPRIESTRGKVTEEAAAGALCGRRPARATPRFRSMAAIDACSSRAIRTREGMSVVDHLRDHRTAGRILG